MENIPVEKRPSQLRFLYINPHGFNGHHVVKVEQLLKYCSRKKVDAVIMAEPSTKWTTGEIKKLKRKFQSYSKNTTIIGSNCNVTMTSKTNHLPGGTLTMLFNSILPYLQTKSIHKDALGRWSAITLIRRHTSILFLTVYRIPNSSDPGPYTSCSQYNEISKRIQTTTHYREQILT